MASSFEGILAFAFLACMLLAGTVLRANVAILRNALVPASLIGGVLGFILLALGLAYGYESSDFQSFTFHFFTLSFMSLVMARGENTSVSAVARGGSWLSLVWVMSLVLQALIGLAVILGYNLMADNQLSEYLGLLVTHGFTQGPGQALALGITAAGRQEGRKMVGFEVAAHTKNSCSQSSGSMPRYMVMRTALLQSAMGLPHRSHIRDGTSTVRFPLSVVM